jgi:hypothetical protein
VSVLLDFDVGEGSGSEAIGVVRADDGAGMTDKKSKSGVFRLRSL